MLSPRPDGRVESAEPVLLPIMAPRLQGEFRPDGMLDLALWGAGSVGRLRFSGLAGPYIFAPNSLEAADGAVHVAQSAPVMVLRGVAYGGFRPASRCAWWDETEHSRAHVVRQGARRRWDLAWACLIVETRGPDLVLALGADRAEAERALELSVEAIAAEGRAYAERCDQLPEADPVLRSMVVQGVHAGLSSVRRDAHGGFAGLAAGLAYSAPARTYYRDGYWTLQLLLSLEPEAVRDQIEILAQGIRPDGEAPSGVILSGDAQARAWEDRRTARPGGVHGRAGDWWSDHFDSPLFFILTLADYARATGDREPARRHWPLVQAIFARYRALEVGGLPAKPRHDRDWADNVYREGHVAYDLGLWVGALDAIAVLGAGHDPQLAQAARTTAAMARAAIPGALSTPQGWFADYAPLAAAAEDHLTLDSLTLLRSRAVGEAEVQQVLTAVGARLESRHNEVQPWGDWGMLCAFPPFKRRADVRSKTAFPYRYHNGADWPWLDGLYAGELLARGLPGWRYPMVRWWETCLANGWMGAVEYFSPPYGRGSLLQGWSSLPAAVALAHRDVVLAG
jgi:hypothetical protein